MMKKVMFILAVSYLLVFGLPGQSQAGDILQATLNVSPNQIDPIKQSKGGEYVYSFLVFSGLTQIDEDLNITGDLAERWDRSEDLKTWTFYL